MIGKDKLGFDITDSDSIAASDSVGAFLRSSDGTLLTHTTVGTKQALDVNVANTISMTNPANFAEDSVHTNADIGTHILAVRNDTEGSLVSADGDYASLQVDANGRLRVLQRALSNTTDSVAAVQSGTWNINSITNTVTVQATDLDIRDLSHTQDSVRIGDGTNFLAYVGSTGIARMADFHTAAANSAVSVDTTAGGVDLVTSALPNRTNMFIQNLGTKNIFVGVGTVTTANGLRLAPGATLEARIGAALSLKAISASGTQDVRVLELA
jgi:hypothetical protein